MKTTKCDDCHEEKELELFIFVNQVDSGFTIYCWDCAVKWGFKQTISKRKMLDEEITQLEHEYRKEKAKLMNLYIRG